MPMPWEKRLVSFTLETPTSEVFCNNRKRKMAYMFPAYLYVTPLELNISTRCLFFLPPEPLRSSSLSGLDSDLYTAAMVEGRRSIESCLPTPHERTGCPKKKFPNGLAGSGTLITRLAGQPNSFGLARLGSFPKKLRLASFSLLMRSRLWGRSSRQTYVHTRDLKPANCC